MPNYRPLSSYFLIKKKKAGLKRKASVLFSYLTESNTEAPDEWLEYDINLLKTPN